MTLDRYENPRQVQGRNSRRSCRSFRKQPPSPGRTMLAMNSQIAIYEEMSVLSARMVKAAQAHDWDRLLHLEKSVVALRRSLSGDDDFSHLTPEEIVAKHALIQRILDDDAEIRRYTEPWMERIRQFLGNDCRRSQPESSHRVSS